MVMTDLPMGWPSLADADSINYVKSNGVPETRVHTLIAQRNSPCFSQISQGSRYGRKSICGFRCLLEMLHAVGNVKCTPKTHVGRPRRALNRFPWLVLAEQQDDEICEVLETVIYLASHSISRTFEACCVSSHLYAVSSTATLHQFKPADLSIGSPESDTALAASMESTWS